MSSILDRMKRKVQEEEAPPVAQVFEKKVEDPEEEESKHIINVQPVVEPKTIKQNNPGTPLMGFTLETLADELGLVLEKAMHKAGINSINCEVFGVFSELGVVPNGFSHYKDEYTGQEFYILRNTNRMTEIFKSLVKALNSSSSELISFPYTVDTELEVPMKYLPAKEEFSYSKLKVTSLYLTPKEIDDLNYKFITEIQFCGKVDGVEDSIDLLAMRIDREEWKAAPFRV